MTRKQNSRRSAHHKQGLSSSAQIIEFIQGSDTPAGKREIAKAFGLKGQEKIALKKRLKDMAEEGLIDGRKTAYHRMGGVPKVTVLRIVEIDDGELWAQPDNWNPDDGGKPPRLLVVETRQGSGRSGSRSRGKGMAALKMGDRILSRTEETGENGSGDWRAYPIKKLPARTEGLMGVVEIDKGGKAWLAPVDKKVRNSSPISDLGGAEAGELVFAEPAERSRRAGVKVIEVVGDPLAPKAFSLIAIAKHGIPTTFPFASLRAVPFFGPLFPRGRVPEPFFLCAGLLPRGSIPPPSPSGIPNFKAPVSAFASPSSNSSRCPTSYRVPLFSPIKACAASS